MATTYALPLSGPTRHNSHSLGHGHGHTRSHHRKAAPERLPLVPTSTNEVSNLNGGSLQKGLLNGTTQQHIYTRSLPLNVLNDTSQTNQRNFQVNHQHLPREKSTGMERRSSRASTTLHAKPSGYGFPTVSTQSNETGSKNHEASPTYDASLTNMILRSFTDLNPSRWMTPSESITSVLIPLPYVLISLLMAPQSLSTLLSRRPETTNVSQPALPMTNSSFYIPLTLSEVVLACALTSTTLLTVGTVGILRRNSSGIDRKKTLLGLGREREKAARSLSKVTTVQRVAGRVLGVGIPFIATMKLGGERIAGVLLVTVASDFFGSIEGNLKSRNLDSWKDRLVMRKWTLVTLFLQFISDVVSLTSDTGYLATIAGYLALGMSASVIPPPYPTSTPKTSLVTSPMPKSTEKTSALATPFEIEPPTIETSPTVARQSPMISTPHDTNLTLAAGIFLAVICSIILCISPSHSDLILSGLFWLSPATLANATSLVFADPKSLRTSRHIGLALGLLLPVIVQELLRARSLLSFACQGVLIGGYWLSSNLDTHSSSSSVHSSKQQHHHHHHHHHDTASTYDHEDYSKFTGMLLRATTPFPLLHSILVEKDSRRIFYFMRYINLFEFLLRCH